MDIPDIYLRKIIEYSEKLKSKNMPLLSWDVHLQNLSQAKKFQEDLTYLKKLTTKAKIESDIINEYAENKFVVVVTDLDLNIEYATYNMVDMTGYRPEEVIGKTPKIFQGPKTDSEISKAIRRKVEAREKFEYTIVNYKKDNSVYDCCIKGFPVYDRLGNVIKFIALEEEVA